MPRTLLLADDSVTIQKVVGISFANEDVELVTVDNGDDAVTKARQVRPDIVLADVVMPGLNGYEVCEAIKQDPDLQAVPVLLLTGTFEAFDEARARSAGADGHITKPFEAQALVDEVNARLANEVATLPVPAAAPPPAALDDAPALSAAPTPPSGGEDAYDFFDGSAAPSDMSPAAEPASAPTTPLLVDDPGPIGSEEPFEEAEPIDLGVPVDLVEPVERAEATAVAEAASFGTEPGAEPASPGMADDGLSDLFAGNDGFANAVTVPPPDATRQLLADDTGDPLAASPALEHDLEPLVEGEPDAGDLLSVDSLAAAPEAVRAELPDLGDPLAGAVDTSDADLGGAAVLDPATGRDYDVSSSDLGELGDLGDSFAAAFAAPGAAEELPAPIDLLDPEPDVRPAPAPDPFGPVEEADPGPFAAPLAAETELEAEPVLAAPEEEFDASPPLRTAATASASEPAPWARQEMRDALEKVAWEAFGDVTERIIREAVARIEQVAWEVVPQMTESLIREELRRLKEGDE